MTRTYRSPNRNCSRSKASTPIRARELDPSINLVRALGGGFDGTPVPAAGGRRR